MRPTRQPEDCHHSHDGDNLNVSNPNAPKIPQIEKPAGNSTRGRLSSRGLRKNAAAQLSQLTRGWIKPSSLLNARTLVAFVLIAVVATVLTVTAFMQEKPSSPVGLTTENAAQANGAQIREKKEAEPTSAQAVSPSSPEAITAATYVFTSSAGNVLEDMSSGTTTMVAPNQDDAASPLFDIGFEFWFDGVRQTQFSANANGLMRLGPTVVSTAFTNNLASSTDVPQIAAYWDDLFLGTNGKVHYKVVGSAPSRKLVVEWTGEQVPRLGVTLQPGTATYQAWLYESTGRIEFVYGSGLVTNTTNSGYSVGFGSAAAVFASVTTTGPTVSYTVSNNTNVAAIASGTKYTFTPTIPTAPSGFNVTGIGQQGMTLNWTDNSSNEVGFAVYRSDDGGTTYNFIQQTVANTSSLVVSSLLPGVSYFWRVFAVTEGNLSAATAGSATTTAAGTKTASTGNWNTAGTWSPSGVPVSTDNVIIPDGVTVTLDTTGLTCSNLTVGGGTSGTLTYAVSTAGGLTVNGSITVNSGATFTAGTGVLTTHTLAVGGAAATVSAGSIVNNGTFDMNTTASALVTFNGNISGSLSGTGGTFDFFAITVSKGANSTPMLDVTVPITMSTVSTSTNRLILTNGTFRLSSASNITPIGGSQTVCASTARLWFNNAGAVYNSGSAGSPTITGELRIDNGTFNYGTGNNTLAMSTGTGILTINGGTLNMLGAVSFASNVGCQFIMSGGSLNVDPNATAALAAGTTVFTIGISTTVNWTGGTITIVDPHSAIAGTAWSASAGGAKLITGGTLNIGDGASTTASGAIGNTTGFGLLNTMGVWNLNINNRTDASNTRMARMTGGVTVFNQLTLQANSYLFMGSSTTGQTLALQGNVVQGGTLAGTEPLGTQLLGTMQLQGFTGTQTVSGGGTYTNIPTLNVLNTGTGVVFTNTLAFVTSRANLFTGSVNPGGLFTIGRATVAPVVQIGGFAAFPLNFSAGSFTSLPAFNNAAGATSYLYANTSTTLTTGAFNEMPAGPQTLSTFLINDPDGITMDRAITCAALTLTAGNISSSAANLLTVSGTTVGSVTGGSATSYVNGPLARTLPASLVSGSTYTFPVGKSAFKMLELVNPTTNAGGTVVIQTEVFDANSGGTPGAGLVLLNTNRYWQSSITSGAGNFTNTTVRLTELVSTGNLIGQSATLAGTYNSIGGTLGGTSTILSTSTITSLGFFNIGVSATLPTGTYTVGTGGTYGTLTLAAADYNSKIITGPVVFSLLDASFTTAPQSPKATGEVFPITINANAGASATNTLTIKPAIGVTSSITGSSASGLIVLNGADWVTMDGSNTVGGTTRDLTLTNTNVGTSSAVIWGQTSSTTDSATNNTIKNLNLIGSGNTQTLIGVGFGSSTISVTSLGTTNNNDTIQNNNISKTQFGIYSGGASATNKNQNNVITQNLINTVSPNNVAKGGIMVGGFENNLQVTRNTVSEIAQGSSLDVFGITIGIASISTSSFSGSEVTNATVSRNIIGSIRNTGTFSACGICLVASTSGTNQISNNTLTGVSANGTSGDFTVGILVGGGLGSTTQVYYNSVSMNGTQAGGSDKSYALAIGGTDPIVDVRDNVLYNVQNNGTGNNYAVGFGYSSFGNLTSNNNDFFVTADGTHFVGATASISAPTNQATLAALQTTTGKDAASISVDPAFNNPLSNLQPLTGSPLLNAGIPVSVVIDINGNPRSGSTPTIGAYETAVDTAGPVISYTPFVNTTSTANRTLSATITDASGVAGAGNAPRVYYRKNGGAYFSNQCGAPTGNIYPCVVDYSLVGGAATGNVFDYFVVAQDTLGNVSANPSAGFVATSVNSVTTPPTIPNSYLIATAITGTRTVCASGCDYTTLTGATGVFNAINTSVATGSIVIQIAGDLIVGEDGTNGLNPLAEEPAGSNFTVKIYPTGTTRAVTGTFSGALVRLNASDRVTIDGSIGGTGTDRSLTITNANAGTSSAVVWLQSNGADGATNDTVKNLNVVGTTVTATPGTLIGIGSGSSTISISSTGTGNNSNTIQNNNITKTTYGIYSGGASAAAKNTGNVITQNVMNAASPNNVTTGGVLANFESGIQITKNDIGNLLKHDGTTGTTNTVFGIALGIVPNNTVTAFTGSDVTGAVVTGNKIDALTQLNATGYSSFGIVVNGVTSGTTLVANNMISQVRSASTASDFSAGIVAGGGTGSTTQIYHNSISMTGTRGAASFPSYGLAINSGDPIVDVRDNIFFNTQTSSSSGKMYAIGTGSTTFANLTSDYNDFFVTGASGFVGQSGGLGTSGADRLDIPAWQSGVGATKDTHSISSSPQFASVSDLHITRTAPATPAPVENVGFLIAAAGNDYDADTRANPPDIGADEVMTVSFSAATYRPESPNSTAEGGTAVITVNRTAGAGAAAAVTFSLGGSAVGGAVCGAGVDYITPASLTLNFAALEASKTFNIVTCADGLFEGPVNETVLMTLTTVSGDAIKGSPDSATLEIVDGDSAPTISISNVTQAEGDVGSTNFIFTVSLSNPAATNVTVDFATAAGITNPATGGAACGAGIDYQNLNGTVTFTPGQTSNNSTILVPVCGDTAFEPNETFFVNLSNNSANSTLPAGTKGTGTITNDDAAVATVGAYSTTNVLLSGDATASPAAPPANATRVSVSATTNFKGTLEVNPTTGVVRVTDAHPAGTYTVTVTPFNGATAGTPQTFTLNVTTPVTCNPVAFAQTPNGVGSSPFAVAVGDFNGDGAQDIVSANSVSNDVSILLGDTGTPGTFTGSSPFGAGTSPRAVAVGDFNSDGKQDLVVANAGALSTNVSVLLGDGSGAFPLASPFTVGTDPRAVAVGDFNGDGKRDIAVANFVSNNVSILLGDGAGSFAIAVNYAAGINPISLVVGDFNNDTKQDLAVANNGADTVSVLLGDGAGGVSSISSFGTDSQPISITLGDFNGDGKQDLVVANNGTDNVTVSLGDNSGVFGSAANFPVNNNPQSVVVGDFNGDGNQDIATANFNSSDVSILLGNGLGSFGPVANYTVGNNAESLAVGDFNNDGRQDLAVARINANNVGVLLRQCAPSITAASALTRVQGSPASNSPIATVSDPETAAGSLNVTATSVPAGITVSNIVNSGGSVTADVAASCAAATGANTVQLTVTDAAGATATANLTVNVDPNTPPALVYPDPQSVGFGGSLNVTPTTNTDNGGITGYTVLTVVPALTSAPMVDSGGVVSITNAQPAGSHVITIRATDTCNGFTDAQFTLNVGTAPTISIDSVSVSEAGGNAVFTVTQSAASGVNTTFTYSTADGSAVAPGDYTAATNTPGMITAGNTTTTISIPIGDDGVFEGSETFTVTLSNPANATIATGTGTGTITDNDTAPTFSIDDIAQNEGNGGPGTTSYTFTITKSGSTELNSSVSYQTIDGSATSPSDFTAIPVTPVTFLPGEATKQFTVLANGDTTVEPNEAFTVHLSAASGATIFDADGTGTITNDDSCTPPSTVYVDDDWVGTTPGTDPDGAGPALNFGCDSFATIQGGVNGVTAGGTVIVRAGTYAEAILINKSLSLQGAQIGQNVNPRFTAFVSGPNGPKANPAFESIITAAATAPASGANDTLHVMSSNVTVDGFVVDGNNPALAQGGATVIGGINTDSRRAIQTEDAAGNPFATSNVTVRFNVIQNFSQRGVELINGTASNTAPATTGSVISQNRIRNFGVDGIVLAFNAYADITNNTVDTNDFPTEAGIWVQDFLNTGAPHPITIANNNVTVGQDNFGGIWVNLAYMPALNIQNNTVNAAAGVVSGSDFTYGIYVTSLRPGSNASSNANFVGSSGGTFDRGIALWNLGTGNTTTVTGGTVGNSVKGVSLHDNDPNFGLAGSNSAASMSGVSIDGTGVTAGVGVFVDATGSTGDTVAMEVCCNTTITNTTTAVSVAGVNASANVHDNLLTIHDNTNAIRLDSGSLTATHNYLYANGTSFHFGASPTGGFVDVHFNRVISPTTAYNNTAGRTLNLLNNWWGCNAGPGNAGCGAVTGTPDTNPWLVLGVSASPASIPAFGNSTITADMRKNSIAANTIGLGTLAPLPVNWSATNGSMSPTSGTILSGVATSMFTSTSSSSGSGCATVDNQLSCTPVTVTVPSFSIDDVTHNEGNGGPNSTSYTFTITKTGAGAASVDYNTVDGSATAPSDYTAIPTTNVSFLSADTTKQFTVFVNGDTTFEGDEAFTTHLSNASGATISDADGTGTIVNDDFADLSLTKSDSPDPVTAGNYLTYTISVPNAGPSAAPNVVVTDTLPPSVTFVSATPSQGSCSGTLTVTCNLGSIANGGNASIVIVVTPNTPGSLSNTASVTSPADNTPGNNGDTATTTVNAAVCTTAPANMVGWWQGNNNANDSAANNTASPVGGVSFVTGKVAQAFNFTGGSFETVAGNPAPLNISGNQVTLDGWIKPTADSDAIYFGKTQSSNNDYLLLHNFGQLSSIIKVAGIEISVHGFANFPTNTVTYVPVVGQWTHIALTYDGATIKLYANAQQVGQGTATGNISNDGAPFNVGGRSGSLFFNGAIDEVEVFNRGLTQAEIAAIYNASLAGKCPIPRATTTTITNAASLSGTPSTFNAPYTVQWSVSTSNGAPSGNVTVNASGDTCFAAVAAGQCQITPSSAGTKSITATYAGDLNFDTSTSAPAVSHLVNKATPTTTITNAASLSSTPTVVGQPYAVNWSVVSPAGSPTGTVTVFVNGNPACNANVSVGTCNVNTFVAGTDSIVASYGGDSNFNNADSTPAVLHTVNKANTTTTITSQSRNATLTGQNFDVFYSVAVDSPGGGTPTGNVQVSDGVNSCTGTVAAGFCTLALNTVGSRNLTATYLLGDANYNASPASSPSTPHSVSDTAVWNGSAGTGWANDANWTTGLAPQTIHKASIPSAGVTNEPKISTSVHIVGFTLAAGRTLTIGIPGSGSLLVDTSSDLAGTILAGPPGPAPNPESPDAVGDPFVTGSLNVTNAGGISIGVNTTVNGVLNLLSGDITMTGGTTLTQPSLGTSTGTFDVIGNVRRQGFSTGNNLSFGNPFNTIAFTIAPTLPSDITVNLVKTAPVDFSSAVQRTYTITTNPSNLGVFTATVRLHYLDSELQSNVEANLNLRRFNGIAWTPVPATGASTIDNWVESSAVHAFSRWTLSSLTPTASDATITGRITEDDGAPVEGAVVRLGGGQSRMTITDAAGNYRFENVETTGFYTVTPSRANFSFSPAQRSFNPVGSHTEALFNASQSGSGVNPLDTSEYFVRQQYLDFLGREPDEAGLNFWVNNIQSCGDDANCLAVKRVDTSAAFFLSIEFQQTGYLVYRTYQSAYGDLVGAPVPVNLAEFRPDTRKIGNGVIVNQTGWETVLENNKQAYMQEFVQRARFVAAYPTTMTPGEFVDRLFLNAGVTPADSDRTAAIDEFGSASTSAAAGARGRALRRVAENSALARQESNQAFVLMQYYGYLRRDANTAPDTDFSGYNFWLEKLNSFNGNFREAEMVKAFLVSSEYRGRFPR